jgi:hypothetical protein
MKRRIIALLAALVIALLPMGAFAQTVVNNSGFQVQNLGTATANITIVYYNTNGTEAARQQDTIPASSSKTYFGSTMSVAAGFNGSVVISSDQPVVAITNLINTGNSLGDSYGGFSGGATTVNLPLILRNNFGIDTWISVQNAGTGDANITVTYTPGSAGTASTDTATIKPGAAATFYQKSKTQLGDRFVGSARIVSDNGQPIVAVVNQEFQSNNALFSYGGFTNNGSTDVAAPLVVSNNFGSFTGIQILNVGSAAATATVTFGANTAADAGNAASKCETPATREFNVPAGGSVTTIQGNGPAAEGFDAQFATCRYIGAARVTSAQPLAVIVNQASFNGSNGSAYAAVDPAATTQSVSAPLVVANNFGIFSGIQVQNTGSAAAAVTVTYGPNGPEASANLPAGQTVCPTPAPRTQTLQPGASFTFIQSNAIPTDPAFDAQFATCRYVGSATISAASGGKITAIVNQINPLIAGDQLFTYSAFGQ